MLIAASGLAREVLAVERDLDRYDEIALIDDDPALWGIKVDGTCIVGGLAALADFGDHDLVVCAGKGSTRRAIVARLEESGVKQDRYATVVHPGASVARGCSVGSGSILLAGTVLTADVSVGDHVVAMPNVSLTHDDVIEDYVTLCAGVSLGGQVVVGSGAYLGMNSSVREHVTVGRNAILGMGSALLEAIPDGQIWAGMPARPLTQQRRN